MMKYNLEIPYIILGSSRSDGETKKAVNAVTKNKPHKLIDLKSVAISYYDYEHENQNDDFIPLIKEMLNYQKWIFATPVYWYSMSAIMKVFFDRMTDLITIEKELGRFLRGKDVYVISSDKGERTNAFEEIFIKTFEYLGMHYQGSLFYYSGTNPKLSSQNESNIKRFIETVYCKN